MGGSQNETLEYNQCQEAVKKLTEYLSNELQPEEEAEVQKHLSQCRGCFSRFHFEETLLKTIRERAMQVRAPGSLRERIMRVLGQPEPGQSNGGSAPPLT